MAANSQATRMVHRFDLGRAAAAGVEVDKPEVAESGTIRVTQATVRMAVPASVKRLSIPTPPAAIAVAVPTPMAAIVVAPRLVAPIAVAAPPPTAIPVVLATAPRALETPRRAPAVVTRQEVHGALVAFAVISSLGTVLASIATLLLFR